MSRTILQIYDSIILEKETFSSLSGLTSPVIPDTAQDMLTELTTASKVGIWRLWFWVVAFAIWTHEQLFDQHITDIENRAKNITPAVTRWYVNESKKFQNGDALVWDGEKYIYSDTTSSAAIAKQIVKQASARDINEIVTIKIAKEVGGSLVELDASEKTSFESYLDDIKIAGTKTIVISDDPDLLKLAYTIQYDPLVMKADGSLIEDDSFPVQNAIDAYIEGLPFDSTFRVQDLTDAIQAARGVVNAVADVIETKYGTLNYEDILAVTTETYLPNAGYLITDPSPIVVLIPDDYDSTQSPAYSIGAQVRYNGIVYEAIEVSADPAGIFDLTKWKTVSNLTFITI